MGHRDEPDAVGNRSPLANRFEYGEGLTQKAPPSNEEVEELLELLTGETEITVTEREHPFEDATEE
jgi:hypothetical protein